MLAPHRIRVLALLAAIGFVVPNAFVVAYLVDHGLAIGDYFSAWFDSLPQTQLTLDITLTATAFLIWAGWDSRRAGVERWWLILPATFLVGICFGLPLYLWMRERAVSPG